MTVYALYIHLSDAEWGNRIMEEVAKVALDDPQYAANQPLLVTVYEHAGWFLVFAKVDGDVCVVGSANDGAAYYGKVGEYRRKLRTARWETIGTIRR